MEIRQSRISLSFKPGRNEIALRSLLFNRLMSKGRSWFPDCGRQITKGGRGPRQWQDAATRPTPQAFEQAVLCIQVHRRTRNPESKTRTGVVPFFHFLDYFTLTTRAYIENTRS